jgi:vacuolar-type H+-ATPase subunit F/Vma7
MSEGLGQPLQIVNARREGQGVFAFVEIAMVQKYNFYDYLRGGVQLNLAVAIDFTASNRHPNDPSSLHFMSPSGDSMNQYEACIKAVGEILCPYDSDQLFPVLGFGAKIRGIVSHCFPLTFQADAPNVSGLAGIQAVYRHALSQIELSGPTCFSHVIRFSTQKAVEAWQESRTYTILLILTDGIINDMQDTIDAIVAAGRLPLSIIIVGVGNANFDAMDVLDADDVPLVSRAGYTMCRDLVQFVPYNKYANKHYSILAQEVLDEVPRQLCEWAEMNGVYPQ